MLYQEQGYVCDVCTSCSSSWDPVRAGRATDGFASVVFLPRSPDWRAEPETAAGWALLASLCIETPATTLEIKRRKTQLPRSSNLVSFCTF